MFRGAAPFMQAGWVVADIDEAIDAWIEHGAGPFFVQRGIVGLPSLYRSTATTIDLAVAWSYLGGLQIELIQQTCDNPSCYRDSFASGLPRGKGGFHHMAMLNPDFDLAYAACRELGFVEAQSGSLDGPRVAYFDTRAQYGFMIEITEACDQLVSFYDELLAAQTDCQGLRIAREL